MDREEAQHILQLCRPGHPEDREDPVIAEALALLEHDDTLRAWFEAQQSFDEQFSSRIEAIEPPSDLKSTILAGMRAHRMHTKAGSQSDEDATIPFPEPAAARTATARSDYWTQKKAWIGIAALFVALFVMISLPRTGQDQLAAGDAIATAGIPDVIQFLARELNSMHMDDFDRLDTQVGPLQSYLASAGLPRPNQVPIGLNQIPTLGCVAFEYNGAKLSMICFRNGDVYHLITANKSDFAELFSTAPALYECEGKAFKAWADGDQILILAVQGGKEDIPEELL